MIRLFTSFYPETSVSRRREILNCLERNLTLRQVDRVCVFLERTQSPIEHPKLETRTIDHRPNYEDFFYWTRELQTGADDISVICNSDIHFDCSLAALQSQLNKTQCVALTRWDVLPDGSARLFHRNDTQDSWIFRGPIRQVVGDYPIGVPRCDNRMLYELKQAGYAVINPAFSIRSYHLHAGQRDEYVQDKLATFVEPPYAYLWPHNLCSLPATCMYNLLNSCGKIGWRIDGHRIRQSLPVRVLSGLMRRLRPKAQ